MPTIEINKSDLEYLCRKKFKTEELRDILENRKISLESENRDVLNLKIEDTNRADLLSVEGIARELKGILGKERGLPVYKLEKNGKPFTVIIDPKVKKVRPFTACCVIKNLKFDEKSIQQIIQLQEKLGDTFGKKRKEAAIGIYDFDKITWPINYTTFKPESLSFQPLGMVDEMNLKQIIEKHEKGQEYGHLLKDNAEYPIFIDSDKKVLSMPPIINSEYSGKVTEKTKNVFIEVSGFDFDKVSFILNIIASALAERDGQIYGVQLKDTIKKITPDFKSRVKTISLEEINSMLGEDFKIREIIEILYKARFYAKIDSKEKNKIIVEIPFYRKDILHNVDIIEEIAMTHGYKKLNSLEPNVYTAGALSEETKYNNNLAEKLIGLEFQEVLSFILSNEDEQFASMCLPEDKNLIKIKNPASETFTCLRKSILPKLLKFLSANIDKDYPQKIFEIGKIIVPDSKMETKTREENHLSLAMTHSKANLTELLEILDYLFKNTQLKSFQLKSLDHPSFIQGRCAEIILNKQSTGILGELNPKILSKWKLRMPVVALEINLDVLK